MPVPTAGVALGLASLGNLLAPWSPALHIVCGSLSLAMVALLVLKVVVHPKLMRDDLGNSIAASVSGTLFMSIMLLARYAAPVAFEAAFAIWALAVVGHCVLIVWFTVKFIRKLKLPEVFPTYFICYVGIIVASVTSPAFGQQELGRILFWFGFTCYIALFVLVTLRYAKHPAPEAARPLFCIYAAPMSLALVGYLSVYDEPNATFVAVLLALAQALYFFVIFHLPKFLKLSFYPSFAAMTFPFVISATALSQGTECLAGAGILALEGSAAGALLGALTVCETLFATGMVVFVLAHYLRFFYRAFTEPCAPDVLAERRADERLEECFEK
ncbi:MULTISPECIES: TDT family transporter [unclassified Adlercreutzia]|uniref:TDT family transporter n=1 Tax=unclassified Adlercreutzia TaxID=2636013 RepID=UPI0013EBACE8|nr:MULTISPECIES: TDT family transporter [unclassified Adlercreutzia]